MAEEDFHRRSIDRELGELSANFKALLREIQHDRKQRDDEHETNTDKLDQVLGIKPMVDSHEAWILTEGKPVVKIVREGVIAVRFGGKGVLIGATLGGGAVGAFVVKVAAVLYAALPH